MLTINFLCLCICPAQEIDPSIDSIQTADSQNRDTLQSVTDSLLINSADSLTVATDSTLSDSIDATDEKKKSPLDAQVDYTADDSLQIDVVKQKAYLFGNAHVTYKDIELTADYIEFDMSDQQVFAAGRADTSGTYQGKPHFLQGSQEFDSDSLRYNFETEKGIIYSVITEEGEGFLHSEKTKKANTGHIHVAGGKYTTCNAEHPHFYMALTKAMVIPEEKIIAGPSYMVVEDIPVPIGLPFGFFPATTSRTSGLIIPSYGNELNRGYYLRDGGWYQVLGEYADLSVMGSIYSKLSWSLRSNMAYRWRYHFNGQLSVQYAVNDNKLIPDYPKSTDFRIRWSHNQDAKANPTQNFSASVNFSSSEFERNQGQSYTGYLTNQKSSSINFSKNWPGTPFNLSLSALASQNSQTEMTNFDLPTGSFNVNRVYPFRKRESTGKKKWYEDVGFSYSSKFQTKSEEHDSVLFTESMFDTVDFGFQHNIPFFINIKTGKLITISPSLSYNGRLYNFYTDYEVLNDTNNNEYIVERRVNELAYAHAINPSIGASFTPKFFGMYANKKSDGYVEAVRHVISPRISASYTPDMRKINPNYYDTIYTTDAEGNVRANVRSKFKNNMYGTPSSNGQSGSISLGLSNTLEMKVHPKNDTTGEGKKVTLLESFNFSTSYNPFIDEFKWSTIGLTGGTKLFDRRLDIRFNGRFDMYDLDSTNNRVNEFVFRNKGQLARLTNMGMTLRYSLRSQKKGKDGSTENTEDIQDRSNIHQDRYNTDFDFVPGYSSGDVVDFDIPWSLNFDYSWTWSKPKNIVTRRSTVNFSGDLSLTPKWKLGFRSGYDIEEKELTFTNFSVHRDLHCWEMQIRVVPYGDRKSYNFTIRAKSALLHDLKVDKNKPWYDNF